MLEENEAERQGDETRASQADQTSAEPETSSRDMSAATSGSSPGVDSETASPAPSTADTTFPPAPVINGEFTLPLDRLVIGDTHPRGIYDFESGVGKALFHAALDPSALPPIVIMSINSVSHVVDGWARVLALRHQHEHDPDVPVRVIEWTGTAKEAIYQRFSQTFLTLASKPVELARQLAQVKQVWGVPDLVLGARIGWTKSKVSKHLTAAEGEHEEPRFALLLLRPTNPSIDYLYRVGKALADAGKDDVQHPRRSPAKGAVAELRKRLEALLARKERFEPKDALVALKLAEPKPEPELPFGAAGGPAGAAGDEPFVLGEVVGHDDVVIGALEMHGDGGRRLLLPNEATVAAMTAVEKASARNAYHEAVDRLFG